MTYIQSVAFGIGGALLAAVLWIVVALVLPMVVPFVIGRLRGTGGVAGAYLTSHSVLIAAVIGFLVTFVWRLRSS